MRAIKFRAWRDDEMLCSDEVGLVAFFDYCADIGGGSPEVMQFTGLTDTNGVEIYENSEIDGEFAVSTKGCDYVLISISCGDIVRLQDYYFGAGGNVKVTREYARVQEDP